VEACAGSSASPRGGSFRSKFQKKKQVETIEVVYDDPATHTCLCCEDYDADCEPVYPCELVKDDGLWGNIDNTENDVADSGDVEDESQIYCLPCEQIRGQRYRLPCIDVNCPDQVHEHDVTRDVEQGEDRHNVIARDAMSVETSESRSTALVIHYDNGSETECASQVHLRPYAIVGDASGVQYSASMSLEDNEIACGDYTRESCSLALICNCRRCGWSSTLCEHVS
jgi:hypothetical protein